MFTRILLPVDGSEHSDRAVPVAGELARKFGGEVVVFHVIEVTSRPLAYPIESTVEESEKTLADTVAKRLKDEGLSARAEVHSAFYGQVARLIAATAESEHCDAIVMGSRGRSDVAGLALGSVTHKVLHFAHCPVVVAR